MNRNYFKTATNLETLKVEYKKLAMANHPDRGGDTATMQAINNEYEELFNYFKDAHNNDETNKYKVTETVDKYRDFIDRIIGLDGLTIEICGSWIWLSGETKKHKDWLKQAGCRWAKSKLMWYFRAEEYKCRRSSGLSMDDIRNKYGSETIHGPFRPKLV